MNTKHMPKITEQVGKDLAAGFVVFLIALPLCLGIPLASGAPVVAGLVSGIIGGILVSMISGSQLSVSGPAAGLTVIILEGIKSVGGYEKFLCAVVISGLMQLVFSLIRAGIIAEYVPSSVIKGMLAGVGGVIILKQIPHALGHDKDLIGDNILSSFFPSENSLTEIVNAITHYSPIITLISISSLVAIIFWERFIIKPKVNFLSKLPSALIASIVGALIAYLIDGSSRTQISPEHFVNIPILSPNTSLLSILIKPDFSYFFDTKILWLGFVIAVVASIETLLSIEAVDRIDPYHRISPTNRELFAQGVGNITSGFMGGLPMTAVIVRSSANVYAGGTTRLSAIFHGLMLLIAVCFLAVFFNKIPLASLAIVLITVGLKLAKPKDFKSMYQSGWDQFIPFLVTFVAVIITDLLTGVVLGLVVAIFFIIRTNHHDAMTLIIEKNECFLRFNKDVSFINKAELKSKLLQIPDDSQLFIDGSKSLFIDKDIVDIINDFTLQAHFRNIQVTIKNIEHKSLSPRLHQLTSSYR